MEVRNEDGVRASAFEIVEVETVERLLASGDTGCFTPGEIAYAGGKSDPGRRLAARLAAKRAAQRLLGEGIELSDIEVRRSEYGPPVLRLSSRAQARLAALGAGGALVSLTHERRHAAALVLILEDA